MSRQCECSAYMKGECACGAWAEERLAKEDEARGDLRAAVTMLAADNCRLIDVVLVADKLASAVRHYKIFKDRGSFRGMIEAVEAFDVVRNGS